MSHACRKRCLSLSTHRERKQNRPKERDDVEIWQFDDIDEMNKQLPWHTRSKMKTSKK